MRRVRVRVSPRGTGKGEGGWGGGGGGGPDLAIFLTKNWYWFSTYLQIWLAYSPFFKSVFVLSLLWKGIS
jgi:hypothetical protein